MYHVLISHSVLLLGERHPNRIVWGQLYSTDKSIEEDNLRKLLLEINHHIMNRRIKSGSARKFLDGKLLYLEVPSVPEENTRNKIMCLFTQDLTIGNSVKKALQAISYRGGVFSVYSASRFFEEMVDLLNNPKKLNSLDVPLSEAITRIKNIDGKRLSVNELGQVISVINRSIGMDQSVLEMLYFQVYEGIESLRDLNEEEKENQEDPDEFLDAAYIIARKYQETDSFYLALELYKKIIPFAHENQRLDLATTCRINIATIYKKNFPSSGSFILDILSEIDLESDLNQTTKKNIEIFYCLQGFAFADINKIQQAINAYEHAIEISKGLVNSPKWIAEAYEFLANNSFTTLKYRDAIRQYLTAVAISFSSGDISIADKYFNHAAMVEIELSHSLIHTAIVGKTEGQDRESEYRAWEAIRTLLRSFMHVQSMQLTKIANKKDTIIHHAEKLLNLPGKRRTNKSILRKVNKVLSSLISSENKSKSLIGQLETVAEIVQENIPMPPPTFMLLTLDGRLIIMGEIRKSVWENSEIEGVLLSGLLSAIMGLITEVSDKKTALRTVDAGNFQILLEQTHNLAAVLLVDRDIPAFRSNLIRILDHIDKSHGHLLRFWDGFVDQTLFNHLKSKVVDLLATID